MSFVESGGSGDSRSNVVGKLEGPKMNRGGWTVGYQVNPWDEYGLNEEQSHGYPFVANWDKCGKGNEGGARWGDCNNWIQNCQALNHEIFLKCQALTYDCVSHSYQEPGEDGWVDGVTFNNLYQDAMLSIASAIGSRRVQAPFTQYGNDPGGNLWERNSQGYYPRETSLIFGGCPSLSLPTPGYKFYGPQQAPEVCNFADVSGVGHSTSFASIDIVPQFYLSNKTMQRLGTSEFCRHRLPMSYAHPESANAQCPKPYVPITASWENGPIGEPQFPWCSIGDIPVLPLEFYDRRLDEYRVRLVEARQRWTEINGADPQVVAAEAAAQDPGILYGGKSAFSEEYQEGEGAKQEAAQRDVDSLLGEAPSMKTPLLLGAVAIGAIVLFSMRKK